MPLIDPGQKAPDFALPDQDGRSHSLAESAGRIVVLYFYPKDDTSGCTDESCQFRDQLPDFSKVNATVLGVSPDSVESHAAFAKKYGLAFPLLADAGRDAQDRPKVCDAYGVWGEKTMYGRKHMGVNRTTYLIDAKGNVARRWDSVRVPGHAAEVLAAVKALAAGGDPAAVAAATAAPAKSEKRGPRTDRGPGGSQTGTHFTPGVRVPRAK